MLDKKGIGLTLVTAMREKTHDSWRMAYSWLLQNANMTDEEIAKLDDIVWERKSL